MKHNELGWKIERSRPLLMKSAPALLISFCSLMMGDAIAECPLGDRSRLLIPLVQDLERPTQLMLFDGDTFAALNVIEPFAVSDTRSLRIATGDLTGDGIDDFIIGAGKNAGAGIGGGPHVLVFDGNTGAPVGSIERADAFGVFVATGDVSGDGVTDIILGAGVGAGSRVRVFSGLDYDGPSAAPIFDELIFNAGFSDGISVAAGDVNGDGIVEIIAGSGAGAASMIRVLDADMIYVRDFSPFGPNFTGGVFVAAGDLDDDQIDDIIVAAGPGLNAQGGGPHVLVFDGNSVHAANTSPPETLLEFSPYATEPPSGQTVAVGIDRNLPTIITAAAATDGPHIKIFSGSSGAELSELQLSDSGMGTSVSVGIANTTLILCSGFETLQ